MSRMGLDPELAIVNRKTGAGRSAHTFMNEPQQFYFFNTLEEQRAQQSNNDYRCEEDCDCGCEEEGRMLGAEVDRDGPAIEVRSLVNSACRDNIIPYVAEAIRQVSLQIDGWKKGAFRLSSTPKFVLDKPSFTNAPEDVLIFGCNPDMDAYTLQPKAPTLDASDKRRWTGGHIHASRVGAKQNVEEQSALAILYDYMVALPIVAIFGEKFAPGETERRQYYGQPGSFRYDDKLDKIEFRTLSGRLLLHPTILYWAMGMVRSIIEGVPHDLSYKQFLKDKIAVHVSPKTVYDVIATHDVTGAEELLDVVFKLIPSYQEDKNSLANPMSGGGGGTTNPYFFEQAARVFVEGNHDGLMWDDDLQFNWGLYDDFIPMHHSYWGIQQAMVGLCDDAIFPFNAVLGKVWPKDLIQKVPSYRHPTLGGDAPMHGSAGWLA